jgi:uncharacterized protein YecE (DUF72 family)
MPISSRKRKETVGADTTQGRSSKKKKAKPQQTLQQITTCGTSGYSYAHWKGVFYPTGCNSSDKQFAYYASQEFDAVELNAPFYRWFKHDTWLKWKEKAETVSSIEKVFTYAVKAHQYFTHWKRLTVDAVFEEKFRGFVNNCRVLGPHCGPLLLQFPAQFECNETTLSRLEQFGKLVHIINNETTGQPPLRVALEFRHHSWFQPRVYKVAATYNLCVCLVHLVNRNPSKWADDMASGFSPSLEDYPFGSSNWGIYARFHGTKGQYEGAYEDSFLDEFLEKCRGQQQLFVFFNNTDDGDPPSAIRDARYICQASRKG